LAGVLAAVTFAAVFTRRWAALLAAALAVLVLNDAVHSFAAAVATHDPLGRQLATVLLGGFYGTLAWIVGLVAIRPLLRRRDLGALLAGITGFFLALVSGGTDVVTLGRSQLEFALPAAFARLEVALSLGLGVGIVAAVAWMSLGPGETLVRSQTRPEPQR
jgi:hypothetical protein